MNHIHELWSQLIRVSHWYREIMDWNPVEALNFLGLRAIALLLTVMIKANLISITAFHVYD